MGQVHSHPLTSRDPSVKAGTPGGLALCSRWRAVSRMRFARSLGGAVWIGPWYLMFLEITRWHHVKPSLAFNSDPIPRTGIRPRVWRPRWWSCAGWSGTTGAPLLPHPMSYRGTRLAVSGGIAQP